MNDDHLQFCLNGIKNSQDTNVGLLRSWRDGVGWCRPYPETSGYILPSLVKAYERTFDREISIAITKIRASLGAYQMPDGGFTTCDRAETYTFDTMAILDGLARSGGVPGNINLPQALQYLDSMWVDGYGFHNARRLSDGARINYSIEWNPGFSYINMRGLAFLKQHGSKTAAKALEWAKNELKRPEWVKTWNKENSLRLGPSRGSKSIFTHPTGYVLEGLLDAYDAGMGQECWDLASRIVEGSVLPFIRPDGYVPFETSMRDGSFKDFAYVCGIAQYAAVLARMYARTKGAAHKSGAERCLRFVRYAIDRTAEQYPEAAGLCLQFMHRDGTYAPEGGVHQINTWTIKYYIDALMALYPRFNWHETSVWYEKTMQGFERQSGRILEMGSASGHMGVPFAQEGYEVILVDRDQLALERAEVAWDGCFVKPTTVNCNFMTASLPGNNDLVYNAGVVQVVPRPVQVEIIKKMIDLTRPGGKVWITIPDTTHPEFRRSPYASEYSPWPLAEVAKDAGLVDIQTHLGKALKDITEPYDFITVTGKRPQ